MLRRAAIAGSFALAAALGSGPASADNVDDDDLTMPSRLTVGVADDLLGQLSSDGKTLYFVSNRDTTNQIFAQDQATGRAQALFDDGADVTWPRVSADGKGLLYISFRDSASGQLCVRTLPAGEGRKCLKDPAAALQAEWIDASHALLVSRQSIQGDLRLLRVDVSGDTLTSQPLLDRNMTSPAVSPDGRWLVYIPVARTEKTVGPAFAGHASQTLEAVPLATPSAAPVKIPLALPGQTGQPAFARDGKSLFVVQFFTDTNHDGAIDASDHGVLFRVPMSFAGGTPETGAPEQLTETSWNCEYPSPAADRLVATCSQDASLDVYSMPLDGEVPAGWSLEMLTNAIDDADTRVVEQLLTSRRLARETTADGRRRAMIALAMVHLEREEFRAAEYYAQGLEALRDEATAGISVALQVMVDERRAERRREQGRLLEGFRKEAQARLDQLRADKAESPMAEDLIHLARSEILDALGDVGKARTELEAVTVDATTPPPIVEAYYQHADGLYRQLDDREALVTACRALATNGGLRPDEQLRYARAAVHAMVRGLPVGEADARLAKERAGASANEAELAFAIDMTRAVLAIRDAHPPAAVGDALLALYGAQPRAGRRRALVVEAVQRADDADADDVLDALVQRDIHDVKRGTHERGEAEDIYERFILARAYERVGAQRYDDARADFDAVTEQTGSYEAVVGAVDMLLKLGGKPEAIQARYERPGVPKARANLARAYLVARELPKLEGDARDRAAAAGKAALEASWGELKEERIAQALSGALLHEDYLQNGQLGTAEEANMHYLVALELVGDNPRLRAMVLGELGLLHTDVGNYRIALGYLRDRDTLPYTDNAEGLDVLLSKAQALLHVGKEGEAAAAGEAALAMIQRNPALAPHKLLALDWAAVDNLAAGHFARARELYDEEIAMIVAAGRPTAERNQLVARVARAAAEVGAEQPGAALVDLDYVEARLDDPRSMGLVQWPHATAEQVVHAYQLIVLGLRGKANRELGRLDAEARAIEGRRAILDQKLAEMRKAQATAVVDVEAQEMLSEAQLASNASERRDATGAGLWLGRALAHADDLHGLANGVASKPQLDVLWLACELTVSTGTPLVPDLAKRIDAAAKELATRREPTLGGYTRWLEVYGALVK